jgi:hypothetical protein
MIVGRKEANKEILRLLAGFTVQGFERKTGIWKDFNI